METAVTGWRPWVLATRPKTLTAAIIPVITATAVALKTNIEIDLFLGFYALLASILIQIGTNFINDALDFKKGADTKDRLGPKRATQMGWLKPQQILAGGCSCFLLAALFSIPLIIQGGIFLIAVLALSITCSYLYTGGPKPLAYIGLGEIFVFLFYGWIGTVTMLYLYTGEMTFQAFLAGTQTGLLCTAIIAVNNFRDAKTDVKADKQTLSVRFGKTFSRYEITLLMTVPYSLSVFWILTNDYLAAFLPLLSLPLAIYIINHLWNKEPGPIYNKYFALTSLHYLLFGLLFSIGLLL